MKRLSSLIYLARPLALTFVGIVLLSLGVGYLLTTICCAMPLPGVFFYLTLQFIAPGLRAVLFLLVGLTVLGYGIWQLSGVVVIPRGEQSGGKEVLLGYGKANRRPRIVVLSGGAGIFVMASLAHQVERLTCITPIQDAVEYYYRASSLFSGAYVDYLPPTPLPTQVLAELDDGSQVNIKQIRQLVVNPRFAERHVARLWLQLADQQPGAAAVQPQPIARVVLDAIAEADAIVLGPGSLFESILPNLLLPELREAIQRSSARKIYLCNLMTEPGLTTGFGVGDHIRQIKSYGGFLPDYVLVNAQRIEPEVQQLYEAAMQVPVLLDPEAYEETAVFQSDPSRQTRMLVEGATVVESDLASALVQYTASLDAPGESRAVRVLRHDPDKLAAAIVALLRR